MYSGQRSYSVRTNVMALYWRPLALMNNFVECKVQATGYKGTKEPRFVVIYSIIHPGVCAKIKLAGSICRTVTEILIVIHPVPLGTFLLVKL